MHRLTYTLGMHRLRESGLAPEIFDCLDERQLTINEIYQFCNMMFVSGGARLPNPNLSWSSFIQTLVGLMEKEKPQWSSVKKGLAPWIDTRILNDYETPMAQSSSRWRMGPSDGREPEEVGGGRSASQRCNRPQKDFDHRRSQSESNVAPDKPHRRSQSESNVAPDKTQRKSPASASRATRPPPIDTSGVTLSDRLKSWSHPTKDAKKPFSVDTLLVTVPLLFPPDNPLVEDHPYFSKWKAIDGDAFKNIDDEAHLRGLLKRGANFTSNVCFLWLLDKLLNLLIPSP